MRKKTIILIGVLAACLPLLGGLLFDLLTGGRNMEIKCMSFNILGIDGYEGYLPVEVRAQHLQTYLNKSGMDLIGLQEAGSHDYDWQEYFVNKLERDGVYKAVTIGAEKAYDEQASRYPPGRVSNSAGLIILYRADRFELLETGSQRYSSTELQERHYQWAKFTDTYSGQTVVMTNTHWSIDWDDKGKVSQEAGDAHRTTQAKQLRAFWEENAKGCLLFATGDYNCQQNSTWLQLAAEGEFKPADIILGNDEQHIDHIFVNTDRVELVEHRFLNDRIVQEDGEHRYSDHDPVFVTVRIKK